MDICYPDQTNWGCALSQQEIDSLDPDVKERAEAMAWTSLQSLTGFRLSLCPIVVRPCAKRCGPAGYDTAVAGEASYFSPYLRGGAWYNACGCTDSCSCGTINALILPTPIGSIVDVIEGGVTLAPTAYRVDNGNSLVRQDGGIWPSCQDMNQPYDGVDAFAVRYYPSLAPNDNLRYAAGILAVEFYKLCNDQPCRLPDGASSINRAGLQIELVTGLFANGQSGIKEVDAIVRVYNPNGLRVPPRAMSPDTMRARVQTGVY